MLSVVASFRLTEWYSKEALKALPYALQEQHKSCQLVYFQDLGDMDGYADFYSLQQLTSFSDLHGFQINNSLRDCMPKFAVDTSHL